MKHALSAFILVLSLLSARHAEAATIEEILYGFQDAIQPLVGVGLGAAVLVFVWGGVLYIARAGNDKEQEKGRERMLWGVVGLFLIVAVWGIVALMRTIIGVGGITDCSAPQINRDGVVNCFE